MMKNLKTVDQAKKEIEILQGFVDLVESPPETLRTNYQGIRIHR